MNTERNPSPVTGEEKCIGYITYYTKKSDGITRFVGADEDYDYSYNFFTIDNEITLRAYFGMYTWLNDKSGFVCGTEDGCFYYYKVAEQKLVYLDQTLPSKGMLGVYVNPQNNLTYYKKRDADGYPQLWYINPKAPTDKKCSIRLLKSSCPSTLKQVRRWRSIPTTTAAILMISSSV